MLLQQVLLCVIPIARAQEDCGDLWGLQAGENEARATKYAHDGDFACALKHRETAAELYADADAYYNLAIAYEDMEQFAKAKTAWYRF
jgi:tetratricopeptide (TPR) repeat protein